MTELEKAVNTIRKECAKHDGPSECNDCPFVMSEGRCALFEDIPEAWKVSSPLQDENKSERKLDVDSIPKEITDWVVLIAALLLVTMKNTHDDRTEKKQCACENTCCHTCGKFVSDYESKAKLFLDTVDACPNCWLFRLDDFFN